MVAAEPVSSMRISANLLAMRKRMGIFRKN
jgi:hypothetical protein